MTGDILSEIYQQIVDLCEAPRQLGGARIPFCERVEGLAGGAGQSQDAGGIQVFFTTATLWRVDFLIPSLAER